VAARNVAAAIATLATVVAAKTVRSAAKAARVAGKTAPKPQRGRPRKTAAAKPKAAAKRQRRASPPETAQPVPPIPPVAGATIAAKVKGVRRTADEMADIEHALADVVKAHPGNRAKTIAAALGCTARDLRDAFLTLEKVGVLHHTGRQQGARYFPGAAVKASRKRGASPIVAAPAETLPHATNGAGHHHAPAEPEQAEAPAEA
jgi:hypothetical protein